MQFRAKPVDVEVRRWPRIRPSDSTAQANEIREWGDGFITDFWGNGNLLHARIIFADGHSADAKPGLWIVKMAWHDYVVLQPEQFEARFEPLMGGAE